MSFRDIPVIVSIMNAKTMSPAGETTNGDASGRKGYLFDQPTSFAQAFPMLGTLKATVGIRPYGSTEEKPQEKHFSLGNPSLDQIGCPKPGCRSGGWPMGEQIRDMIAKRETHRHVEAKCNGKQWIVGPKFRNCMAHFTAEIELTYKPEAAKDSAAVAPPSQK